MGREPAAVRVVRRGERARMERRCMVVCITGGFEECK